MPDVKQRVRRPRERNSLALLETAARVEFAEFGYAGARVERIARRAGVNKQLVFYYFGSKQQLYDSVIARLAGEATENNEPKGRSIHAAEGLRESFSSLFDSLARRSDLARLIVTEIPRSGVAKDSYGKALQSFTSEMRRVIEAGQAHGYFRDDIDPDKAAQQAVILALGYVALERVLEGPPDPARARTWRDATADLLVRALAW
jgi:AcrR family transcriptional regulator